MKKLLLALIAVIFLATILPISVNATTVAYYSTTADGFITVTNANYATANAAASGTVDDTSPQYTAIGQTFFPGTSLYHIYRGYFPFDTSGLPDDATITSATLYFYVYSNATTTDFNLTVQNGQPTYPHIPLEAGDYNSANYSGNGGTRDTTTFGAGWNTLTLNATGIGWISKTGTTKLCLRSSRDIAGTAPDGNEHFYMTSANADGTSLDPYISIEYTVTTNPVVTATAATSVLDVSARLNGSITSDGGYPAGVEVSWGYGKVSQTAGNFASYTTVTAFAGTYSTGNTPFLAIDTLTPGSTYYFRFQAKNTKGTTTSGELYFTTLAAPTITVKPASNVAQTSARLNGQINNSGGEPCEIRWGYGTTTQIVANFAAYDTVTAWGGSYNTGALPYLDIGGLAGAGTYYFRFQARNSIGTVTSGELDFTTESSVGAPSNLIGIPAVETINLSWSSGAGSTRYMLRTKSGSFPTTETDGTLVYFDTGLEYTVTGLTAGTNYYYSLWGESGGDYSAVVSLLVTTNAGIPAGTDGVALAAPWRWMSAPDYTNLSNLPIVYDAVNGVADAMLIPRASFWMLMALVSTAFFGLMAYIGNRAGEHSQAIGMIIVLLLLSVWWAAKIVPFYIILLALLFTIFTIGAKKAVD